MDIQESVNKKTKIRSPENNYPITIGGNKYTGLVKKDLIKVINGDVYVKKGGRFVPAEMV